ncbi:MAG: hypothetical protein IJ131_05310 [Eggerthellaceae bacterium]|nr:hypothetical protein [Eggerthellaceae bacterium]
MGYFNSRSSFRSPRLDEDVDPMTSMSGIGDVMLVFACGLMTALIVAWSVDLGKFAQVEVGEQIAGFQNATEGESSSGSGYVEMGKVYMDPTTGEYYLVEDDTSAQGGVAG